MAKINENQLNTVVTWLKNYVNSKVGGGSSTSPTQSNAPKIETLTKTKYDEITTKDPETIYMVIADE